MNNKVPGWGRATASPSDKMALARDYVRVHAPYFSRILYGITFVPVPGIQTMGTTKDLVCGYDPVFVENTEPKVLAAVIAHEIMHVLSHHFDRLARCKDKARANIAADLAINPPLRAAMHKGKPVWLLPEIGVLPQHFGLPEGKTAEQYYHLLEQQEQDKKKAAGQGQKQNPNGTKAGQGQGSAPNPNGVPSPSPGGQPAPGSGTEPGQGEQHGCGAGHCGSVAGGKDHPALAGVAGRSEVEKKAMVMQAAKAIKDHVAQHGRGSVPDNLVEMVTPRGLAKRSWKGELARLIRKCTGRIQSGGDDYSMSRPSKRSYLRGMIRPGLIENLPVVAIVLDTSGSMGVQDIHAALIEVAAILQALGIDEFWFGQADAQMAMPFTMVNKAYLKDLKVLGRGGTDFRPAFAALQKLNPRPDLLVYGTDGDGQAPPHPPRGIETIWCVVPSYYNRKSAKWGHTVLASDDASLQLREPYEADVA